LVDGDSLKTAIKVGNATAALAIQEIGALADLPAKDEIIKEFEIN
jgi:sugar/nucleoside kinase (ribokinase family)